MYEIITMGRILCPAFSAIHWNDVLETVFFLCVCVCAVDKNIEDKSFLFYSFSVLSCISWMNFTFMYTLYVCQW